MDNATEQDFREAMEKKVKQWAGFMSTEEVIEKMMEALDSQKQNNQKENMIGFSFRMNKQTKSWYVFFLMEGWKEEKCVSTEKVGKCEISTYREVFDFLKTVNGFTIDELFEEKEEILNCKVMFK